MCGWVVECKFDLIILGMCGIKFVCFGLLIVGEMEIGWWFVCEY